MSFAPQRISDEELARQTRAGSLESFEELVLRYQGRIFRFVLVRHERLSNTWFQYRDQVRLVRHPLAVIRRLA